MIKCNLIIGKTKIPFGIHAKYSIKESFFSLISILISYELLKTCWSKVLDER